MILALEKAKFLNNNNEIAIEVQFNPSSLLINTEAMISEQKTQQTDSDSFIINMGGIKSRVLEVSIVLDSYQAVSSESYSLFRNTGNQNKDVKSVVDKLENFMNTSTDISFIWGKIIFTGVIKNLQTKYEMFSSDGSPVRATVGISIAEKAYQGKDVGGTSDFDMNQFDLEKIGDMSEEEILSGLAFL